MTAPLHLLLVEDLAPLRRRLLAVLTSIDGVTVRACGGWREALDALADLDTPLHGALVDRELPDGRGEDVLEAVAQAHPNAVRTLMTGAGRPRGESPLEGVLVLEKPFSVERLERWVSELRSRPPR